jgi:hypothetical protein
MAAEAIEDDARRMSRVVSPFDPSASRWRLATAARSKTAASSDVVASGSSATWRLGTTRVWPSRIDPIVRNASASAFSATREAIDDPATISQNTQG